MKIYPTANGTFTVFEPGDKVRVQMVYRGHPCDWVGTVTHRNESIENGWNPYYMVTGGVSWIRHDHVTVAE